MNRYHSLRYGRAVFFLVMLLVAVPASANASPLQLTLEPLGQDQLEVTMRNISENTVQVLRWTTPFEGGLPGDYFDIRMADQPAAGRLTYKGRLLKRAAPLPEDYIRLAAGQSIRQVVALAQHYDIPETADYRVVFDGSVQWQSDQQFVDVTAPVRQGQSQSLRSEPVTMLLVSVPATSAAQVAGYLSCSVSQQAELNSALQASEQITNVARDGLLGLSGDQLSNSPRYSYWFGEYSAQRFDTVVRTYDQASAVMAAGLIDFNCSCSENGVFAYVFPSRPYTIYICPEFWNASVFGADSRAGTILHELSHFPEIAGTVDTVYGTTRAANLATTDPDGAVINADNIEYFAENTPSIPIFNSVVFTDIAVDNAVNNDLSEGESSFYKVTGANLVQLTSFAGDADLYVYGSAAATSNNILCRSVSPSGLDSCTLDSNRVAYIEVRGFSESRFTLVAQSDPQQQEQPVVDTQSGSTDSTTRPTIIGGGAFGFWFLLLVYGCGRLNSFRCVRRASRC